MKRTHIVGPGRAGCSLADALEIAGWARPTLFARGDDISRVGVDAELVIIATPDRSVAEVAAQVTTRDDLVVAHLCGSLGLDVLAPHRRVAAIHPLVALPNAETGAQRLRGAWFAVAGDPVAEEVVASLHGRSFVVADEDRARYHAAAVVASNHLVALLGQAQRIAASAGVPAAAIVDLAAGSLEDVRELGPAAALTGPAARGDEATIARHLDALPIEERETYAALATEARRLAGRPAAARE